MEVLLFYNLTRTGSIGRRGSCINACGSWAQQRYTPAGKPTSNMQRGTSDPCARRLRLFTDYYADWKGLLSRG
jgi:hypothetical protein